MSGEMIPPNFRILNWLNQSAELKNTKKTPGSLGEAIDALESDHAFLLKGNVFTDDLIRGWIEWKRNKEIDPMRMRPVPYEFDLYYDS